MRHSYKAVFFDLDETLRIPSPSPTDALVSFVRSLNVPVPPEGAKRIKLFAHQYWGQEERLKLDMDRLGPDAFWLQYSKLGLKIAGLEGELHQYAEKLRDWFFRDYRPHVSLAHGALETLQALKRRGLRLGLISNRSAPMHDEVRALGLAGVFEVLVTAGEVGCWKPNPRIFHHALGFFENLAPSECVYVGDNYYADGYGAEQAGLVPVLFDPDGLYGQMACQRIERIDELLELLA